MAARHRSTDPTRAKAKRIQAANAPTGAPRPAPPAAPSVSRVASPAPPTTWWSKISLFYKILGALVLTFVLAGFTPKSILGQSCGSLFFPARSTLQGDFAPMMNHACSEALHPRLVIVVITALILIVIILFVIKAGFEALKDWHTHRARRQR